MLGALCLSAALFGQVDLGPRPGAAQVIIPRNSARAMALPSDAELAKVRLDPEMVRLARELDAELYPERAAARAAIEARKPTPEELMAVLLRKDLGVEARHVLVGILRDRIMNAPRGALGIRMEGFGAAGGGVRVSGLVAGMPAERVLKVGDLIREINGNVLGDRSDLVQVVQGLPPGAAVKVAVLRARRDEAGKPIIGPEGGEVLEELAFDLRLGSTEQLVDDQLGPNQPAVLSGAAIERQLTADAAARRFLPEPTSVRIPAREARKSARGPISVESMRERLLEAQVGGADPTLVGVLRARVEELALRLGRIRNTEDKRLFEEDLEALEVEIRAVSE